MATRAIPDRLLVDTHVVLWWLADDPRLDATARELIATADVVLVSAVSAWEVELKRSLGKLELRRGFVEAVRRSGLQELDVTLDHAEEFGKLVPHHGDPFDRMLAAQARAERLPLLTADRAFEPYGLSVIWV